ncbi:4'-phosphopantetheinyl transferase family protein [Chelatococcus reniformis]|uniref:4'-phosphopantetheinyl transferase n=1 Tax=Chelatococcus reniformis TaxID=1494448 RepID=A0A916XGP5_9HYPH|nr:4'-phosphopantetheinyl transferase superfamily protein [Chelatococcus reniformis]GGC72223.1 4'-phosphopantetheinyl transferase [Chelatococcus reniformis]
MTSQIDVWLFGLDRALDEMCHLERWLSPDERDRAARFVRARDRLRFTAARGMLRRILGAEVDRDPASLGFAYNAHGKPTLAGDAGPHFNLSHSGALAALGIGRSVPFGLDIEQIVQIEAGVAEISFSPAERSALAVYGGAEWLACFYRCWTRKEAVIKALGLGLAQPLDAFDVTLGPSEEPRLLRLAGAPEASSQWELFHFEPAAGYMGAVAVPAPGHSIVVRRWMP